MRTPTAAVLTVQSPTRERIYGALLAQPGAEWTVREMAELMPQVSVEGVRATLHLLLGDRLVDVVTKRRSLTVRLTSDGEEILAAIMRGWETGSSPAVAPPKAQGERNSR